MLSLSPIFSSYIELHDTSSLLLLKVFKFVETVLKILMSIYTCKTGFRSHIRLPAVLYVFWKMKIKHGFSIIEIFGILKQISQLMGDGQNI